MASRAPIPEQSSRCTRQGGPFTRTESRLRSERHRGQRRPPERLVNEPLGGVRLGARAAESGRSTARREQRARSPRTAPSLPASRSARTHLAVRPPLSGSRSNRHGCAVRIRSCLGAAVPRAGHVPFQGRRHRSARPGMPGLAAHVGGCGRADRAARGGICGGMAVPPHPGRPDRPSKFSGRGRDARPRSTAAPAPHRRAGPLRVRQLPRCGRAALEAAPPVGPRTPAAGPARRSRAA